MIMDKRKNRTYFLMILPAFIGFIILFIVPAIMSFGYSLTNWSVYNADIDFIGFRNFQKLFQDAKTVVAIEHSVVYAILITIIQNVLSIILAVLLNRNSKVTNFVKGITFLPAVLSIMVVGYLFQYIMTSADGGLLNSIIQFFGWNLSTGSATATLRCTRFLQRRYGSGRDIRWSSMWRT